MILVHGIVYCVKLGHSIFPFTLCDEIEIQNRNNSNFSIPSQKFEVVTEASKFLFNFENEPDHFCVQVAIITQLMKYEI